MIYLELGTLYKVRGVMWNKVWQGELKYQSAYFIKVGLKTKFLTPKAIERIEMYTYNIIQYKTY